MSFRVTNTTGVDRTLNLEGGGTTVVKNGKSKVVNLRAMSPFIMKKWARAGLIIAPADEVSAKQAEAMVGPDDVDIPDDWEQLSAADKKTLAVKLGYDTPSTAAEARMAIEEALAGREKDRVEDRIIGQPLTPEQPE